MIKVSDNFAITRDQYCWTLHEKYKARDKNKDVCTKVRKSYHANLDQCLRYARDIEAGSCTDLNRILNALQKSYRLEVISVDRFVNEAGIHSDKTEEVK